MTRHRLRLGVLTGLAVLALSATALAPSARAAPAAPPPAAPPAEEETVVVEAEEQVVLPRAQAQPLPVQAAQAGSRIVVTREQFQQTQKTVADVIEAAPGLNVTRAGDAAAPAKVTLRGGRTDQVLVIVDGVPQNLETDNPAQGRVTGRQGVDLATLDLSRVESIEIVRGAATSLYGPGAAAGAIVVHLRRPTQPEALLQHTEGSGGFNDTSADWAQPIGAGTLTLNARHRTTQGTYVFYDPAAAQALALAPNPCAQNLGGGYLLRRCNQSQLDTLALGWLRGEKQRWSLDWQSVDRQGLGGVEDPRPFGREQLTRIGAGYSGNHRPSANTEAFWRFDATETSGQHTDNAQLSTGVLENRHTEDSALGEAWAEQTWGRQRARLSASAARLAIRDQYFSARRDQGSLAARWSADRDSGGLEASLRQDEFSDVAGQGTYRVAATQALGWGLGLKASRATGYRPPTLYELYDPGATPGTTVANPALKPESSTSTDGGLYYEIKDRFYGEGLAFEQDFENNIVALANPLSPALFRFENLTRTRSTGTELLLAWRPAPAWALNLTATHTDAILLANDALDPRDNGNQVPGIPADKASLELSWRRETWSVVFKGRTAGRRYVDTANTRYLQPYQVWDAALNFPLPWSCEGAVEGRNLTNQTYAEVDNFPAPGLQIFLTLRWRYPPTRPAAPPPAPLAAPAQPVARPSAEPSPSEYPYH